MDTRGKQVSFNVEPPTGWRQVIVWALVYTLIGAAIAVIALSLPLSHRELYHQLFGGLNDIDLNYYWYDVVSVAAITALSFLIGLRRRSVAKLILFALFSSLGTAMIVGSLERYGAPVYTTYLIVFTIALLVGVLMFYRSMIFDLLRETWGSHPVENSTQAKTELKEQPKPAEDIKDIITESSTVSDGSS